MSSSLYGRGGFQSAFRAVGKASGVWGGGGGQDSSMCVEKLTCGLSIECWGGRQAGAGHRCVVWKVGVEGG